MHLLNKIVNKMAELTTAVLHSACGNGRTSKTGGYGP